MTKTYAIHPAIGIARLGNLALDPANHATFYLGPESPHQVANEGRPYKAGGRIKKQAQRFRIYEFEDGRATREITLDAEGVTAIEWTVQLANRKAALDPAATGCPVSVPGIAPSAYAPAKTRNAGFCGERSALAIDPGPRTVSRPGTPIECSGRIELPNGDGSIGRDVKIGTLAIEESTGRLLVFAADGISEGVLNGEFSQAARIETYANHDGWYDDTADGRVTAAVTFADGRVVRLEQPAEAAWVLCVLPRYAPGMGYFTTLHDVAVDAVAEPAAWPAQPSFMRDIYPILASASVLGAANSVATGRHDYLGSMARLADPGLDARPVREKIFGRIRNPDGQDYSARAMPRLPQDVLDSRTDPDDGTPFDVSAFTRFQYAMLEKWQDGEFVNDLREDPCVPLEEMAVTDQPDALDRAALDGSAGTPFYPGIESWRIMRDAPIYAAPLRLKAEVRPGDLTMGNALPWQADFLDCDDAWWPVQRPTHVMRDGNLQPWVPPDWFDGVENYNEMVRQWWRLGMLVSRDGGKSFAEEDGSAGPVGT